MTHYIIYNHKSSIQVGPWKKNKKNNDNSKEQVGKVKDIQAFFLLLLLQVALIFCLVFQAPTLEPTETVLNNTSEFKNRHYDQEEEQGRIKKQTTWENNNPMWVF